MDTKKKVFKNNKKFRYLFILLIGVVLSICIFMIFKFTSTPIGNMRNIPFNGNYKNIAILEKEICILEENNLKIYDEEGNEIKNVTLETSEGKLEGSNNKLFVSSKDAVYILNNQGTLIKKLEIPFETKNTKVDENLYVFGDKQFQIYDLEGKLILEDAFKSVISTMSLSSNKEKLVATTLDATKDNFKSDLYLNNIKDNKDASQTFINEVIMYSKFIDEDRYLTVSNKQMILFDSFAIVNKVMLNDFKDISFSDSNIYLLNGDLLNVYDFDLTLKVSIELEVDFSSIYCEGSKVILIGTNNYGYYKDKSTKLNKIVDTEEVYGHIINNNGLYLLHSDSVTKIDLGILGGQK